MPEISVYMLPCFQMGTVSTLNLQLYHYRPACMENAYVVLHKTYTRIP